MEKTGVSGHAGEGRNPGTRPVRDFAVRLVTSCVVAPLFLAVTWVGGLSFLLLVTAISVLIFFEWNRIAGGVTFQLLAGLAAILPCAAIFAQDAERAAALAAMCGFVILAAAVVNRASLWVPPGFAFAVSFMLCLLALRFGESGRAMTLFVILAVWCSDISAYLVGRRLGGPRLWATLSPNKTWSGALGGFFISTLAGGLWWVAHGGAWTGIALAGALAGFLSIVTQAGDLMESALKRAHNVKNSGGLLPGHGGILDRMDGFASAVIVMVALGIFDGRAFLQSVIEPAIAP